MIWHAVDRAYIQNFLDENPQKDSEFLIHRDDFEGILERWNWAALDLKKKKIALSSEQLQLEPEKQQEIRKNLELKVQLELFNMAEKYVAKLQAHNLRIVSFPFDCRKEGESCVSNQLRDNYNQVAAATAVMTGGVSFDFPLRVPDMGVDARRNRFLELYAFFLKYIVLASPQGKVTFPIEFVFHSDFFREQDLPFCRFLSVQ